MRKIDLNKERERILKFIKKELRDAGMKKLIVGISGGIDSAVTAAMCVEAIGKENVIGLLLPYRKSHPDSLKHGKQLSEFLCIKTELVDISPMIDAYFDNYEPIANFHRRGNRMARERMCVLYDKSAKYKGLVAGTGNKSELMTGYVTQYGDGACAFEPLGHLYKTEVYRLAELMRIPSELIDKKPTADLWANQTDEEELGISYEVLDELLYRLYELKQTKETIIRAGYLEKDIVRVKELYNRSEFKRHLPPQLKVITI